MKTFWCIDKVKVLFKKKFNSLKTPGLIFIQNGK